MSKPPVSLETLSLIHHALRNCALFRDWPDTAVDRIASIAHLERYERFTQVLAQDRQRREVLVVAAGCLEVGGVNASGAKFVLGLIGPAEIVGLIRLRREGLLMYDYHAYESTVLVHLPSDELRAILDSVPLLWKDVALLMLERHSDSIVSLQRRALGHFQQGLAETLVKLAGWYGQPIDGGPAIGLRVSQGDLASMLSVSRQTMNKELSLLVQGGMLSVDYGRLTILDLQTLRRMAEGTHDAINHDTQNK